MVLVASPAPGGPARRSAGSVWTALCAAGRNQQQTAAAGGFLLWPLAASPELPVAAEPYPPAQPFSGSPLQPAQLINVRGEPPLMPRGGSSNHAECGLLMLQGGIRSFARDRSSDYLLGDKLLHLPGLLSGQRLRKLTPAAGQLRFILFCCLLMLTTVCHPFCLDP